MTHARLSAWLGTVCLGVLLFAAPVYAEEAPAATAEPRTVPDDPVVAKIKGTSVNIRVGPRIDGTPIVKLNDGDVVVIVERASDWVGVWVPAGLAAAVASRYVTPVGEDAVRVDATNLNLRVMPPQSGGPMPPAFRDRAKDKELLTLIRSEGDWTWVLAPERVRAYVHARYVEEIGPVSSKPPELQEARAKRRAWAADLAQNRMARRVARAGEALRSAMGGIQEQFHSLRLKGGWDRTPIVALATLLDTARERHPLAPARLRQLAAALRADLESEVSIRVARRNAEIARARGLSPDPEQLPAPRVSSVTLRGVLRWEPMPRWRNRGAWILWSKDQPTHVVRLTTGMPLPHPDLRTHADERPRTVKGRQPGERLFGLPVIELKSIRR